MFLSFSPILLTHSPYTDILLKIDIRFLHQILVPRRTDKVIVINAYNKMLFFREMKNEPTA